MSFESQTSCVLLAEHLKCKSVGARKLRLRASHSWAGLSERKILDEMISNSKYRKFNAKFTIKLIPCPKKVNNFVSQMQIDLVSMKSQAVECEGKTLIHTVTNGHLQQLSFAGTSAA